MNTKKPVISGHDRPVPTDTPQVERTVQRDLTPKPTEVAQPGTLTARDLARLLMTADSATKAVISKALGGAGIKVKKSRAGRNRNHLETMRSVGEATHEDTVDGEFLPVPPEGIKDRGSDAIAAWHAAWREGRTFSSGSMDIDDDLENIAMMALE